MKSTLLCFLSNITYKGESSICHFEHTANHGEVAFSQCLAVCVLIKALYTLRFREQCSGVWLPTFVIFL